MNIEKKELLFYIMTVKYIKAMRREVSKDPKVNSDLYPTYWFTNKDYIKKTNILAEAIEKKCLISETKGYLDIIEGVKPKE